MTHGARTSARRRQPASTSDRCALSTTPTSGQLYLLGYSQCNAATGEDVRNLWRADAERLHLPAEDFWIFDSRLVALLNFDDADVLLNIELITEPAEVVRYCQVRDAAWHHAIPYETFAAEVSAAE